PEAWAGLKQRLVEHAKQIEHPDLSRMYREDWLNRFYELRRPTQSPIPGANRDRRPFAQGQRWTPPAPPLGANARAIAQQGIDAPSEEVEQALVDATERLKRDVTEEAYEEQQRLKQAQKELRQRLASLAGTD